MSQLGILAREFEESSRFLHNLNEATIIVKKAFYSLQPVSAEMYQRAVQTITQVLDMLLATCQDSHSPIILIINHNLIEKYHHNTSQCVADLQACIDHVSKGRQYVTESDLELLDTISGILDDNAELLFRKMGEL